MPRVRIFGTADADYRDLRVRAGGSQQVAEWVTPADGHPDGGTDA